MIEVRFWHKKDLGNICYQEGFIQRHIIKGQLKEAPVTYEKEVITRRGVEIAQEYIVKKNYVMYAFLNVIQYQDFATLPMHSEVRITDDSTDDIFINPSNIEIEVLDSYDAGAWYSIAIKFTDDVIVYNNSQLNIT